MTTERAFCVVSPLIAAGLLVLAACTPGERARQSMSSGDPVRASAQYREALLESPHDPQLRAGYEAARTAAGRELARRAEGALEAGREQQAIALARQAADHDPARRSTEVRIRHAIARGRLGAAAEHLDRGVFELARMEAEAAQTVAHDLPEVAAMLRRIDEAHGRDLAEDAQALAEVGRFDQAERLAARAAELVPGDAVIGSLPGELEIRGRERHFDRVLTEAGADLAAGRLDALAVKLGEMEGLDVRHEALAEIRTAYEARKGRLDNALAAARAARTSGDYTESLRRYVAAAELAPHRAEIREEAEACRTDQRLAGLLGRGKSAAEQGDYEAAAELYREALDVRADASTEGLLRESVAAFHRKALYEALDRDDRPSAIGHLQQLLRHQPDETTERILYRLHVELADAALTRAEQHRGAGEVEKAIGVLDEAMQYVQDERISALRRVLVADHLTEQAVEAEKAGAPDVAHARYLEALAADPTRAGIAERLDEVKTLAELRRRIETLEELLGERERTIQTLEADVRYWHDRAER